MLAGKLSCETKIDRSMGSRQQVLEVICCEHGNACSRGRREQGEGKGGGGKKSSSRASTPTTRSSTSSGMKEARSAHNLHPISPRTPPPPPAHKQLPTYVHYVTKNPDPHVSLKMAQGSYVGVLDPLRAERFVVRPTSFVLYHQQKLTDDEIRDAIHQSNEDYRRTGIYSIEEVSPLLDLCIVYRTQDGNAVHFPIVIDESDGSKPLYSVGCAPQSHKFLTIAGLVRFYTIFNCDNKLDADGIGGEVFPLNLDSFRMPPPKANESSKKSAHV